MKLLLCPRCGDMFKLHNQDMQYCQCGKSGGRYIDRHNAVYCGKAIPIGIDNFSLAQAAQSPAREDGMGVGFEAFVIPWTSPTVKREEEK